ncbi:MAG: histidine phosphatase family protein [Bacteroidia bacterium]
MKLYILRHGETDFNRQGIVQGGGVDSDLNDEGRRQAQRFFEHYNHLRFDAVYGSDLKRTHQTLEPWLRQHDYELRIEPAIREFSWGDLEGKRPSPEDNRQFLEMKNAWSQGVLDIGVKGGDTPTSFWQRLEPVIWDMAARHQGETVLACSHGRTLRILLSQLIGNGMHEMETFQHKNTGVNVLQFVDSQRVEAILVNDIQHLDK